MRVPQARAVGRTTRQRSPVNPSARARLERRVQPLFDNVVVSSTSTGELLMFRDQIGTNGKSKLDTNMEKPGALPTPRVFDIYGFELSLSQGLSNRTTGIPANELLANAASDFLNSMKGILYSTWLEFSVGTKAYVQAPAYMLPSNEGISGGLFGGDTATANGVRETFGQGVGMSWSIASKPIRLVPDQTFGAKLSLTVTGAGIPGATSGHVVYLYLLGLHYVEVM